MHTWFSNMDFKVPPCHRWNSIGHVKQGYSHRVRNIWTHYLCLVSALYLYFCIFWIYSMVITLIVLEYVGNIADNILIQHRLQSVHNLIKSEREFIWSLHVIVHGPLLVLVLCLLGCGCAQYFLGLGFSFAGLWLYRVFPGLGLAFAGLWLCTGLPWSWSCLCWALVVHRFPLVLVYYLLGCGCV